jgi:hypothetical protein
MASGPGVFPGAPHPSVGRCGGRSVVSELVGWLVGVPVEDQVQIVEDAKEDPRK